MRGRSERGVRLSGERYDDRLVQLVDQIVDDRDVDRLARHAWIERQRATSQRVVHASADCRSAGRCIVHGNCLTRSARKRHGQLARRGPLVPAGVCEGKPDRRSGIVVVDGVRVERRSAQCGIRWSGESHFDRFSGFIDSVIHNGDIDRLARHSRRESQQSRRECVVDSAAGCRTSGCGVIHGDGASRGSGQRDGELSRRCALGAARVVDRELH